MNLLNLPDAEVAIQREEQRVHPGGHDIPTVTTCRRFERGWENIPNDYLGGVDDRLIDDASQAPATLIRTGDTRPPATLMEDPVPYRTADSTPGPVQLLEDPALISCRSERPNGT
ncbi:MAG: hypothetical protein V4584_07030 [Verrucomicrobiota bacterium]